MAGKPQRIRDPLHDLITFGDEEFERTMWQVIQTEPFQRLRRVRQLGFSEFTFPGATHTRFAHSLGVFHTARQLMAIVKERAPTAEFSGTKAKIAVAAALVHDVGHGMFSHAFENVAEELGLGFADHEAVSAYLIRESEIAGKLDAGGVNPAYVATLIGRKGPADMYDAVVSSQFDADRLDYMRRDRLMSGVQSGGIDFTWLLRNLELGEVISSPGDLGGEEPDRVLTFVLGPKAIMAAEAYVLSLFQLYPTLYLHKATRGAEMLFKALMVRVFNLLADGQREDTGLPQSHPFVKLADNPGKMSNVLELDDTVFWGSLYCFRDAQDKGVQFLAERLSGRRLPKSLDVGSEIQRWLHQKMADANDNELEKAWTRATTEIQDGISKWCENGNQPSYPRILFDSGKRDPYSTNEKKGQLNRIHVKENDGTVTDIRGYSRIIAAMKPYRFARAYWFEGDDEAKDTISKIVKSVIGR